MSTTVAVELPEASSSVMAQEMALCEAAEEQLRQYTARHAAVFCQVSRRSERLVQLLQEQQLPHVLAAQQSAVAAHPVLQPEEALAPRVEQHRLRRRTLLQHASLLELIELPNLMDACIRSSSASKDTHVDDDYYEEALQIAAFANTLERRHWGDDNRVVAHVLQQIRSRQAELRPLLLARLRTTSTTMSECLEVITALRRLNHLELEQRSSGDRTTTWEEVHADAERQLQIAFLEARDAWVDTTSSTIQETLLEAIERHRTRLFEVATQFNAIFRTQSSTSSQQLLALWMARRVQSFLQFLRTAVPDVPDAAALRDALEASVFFATSLGRLGADFASRLGDVFGAAVVLIVTRPWIEGVAQLQETLELCRDAGVAGPLMDAVGATEEAEDALLSTTTVSMDEPLPPPKSLLALPPLARLVNAVLTGLNALRRCLLPEVRFTLRDCLETQVIAMVEHVLRTHERTVLTPGWAGEAAALRASAAHLSATFRDLVTPYLRGALECALGTPQAFQTFLELRAARAREAVKDVLVEEAVHEMEHEMEHVTEDVVVQEPTQTGEEVDNEALETGEAVDNEALETGEEVGNETLENETMEIGDEVSRTAVHEVELGP